MGSGQLNSRGEAGVERCRRAAVTANINHHSAKISIWNVSGSEDDRFPESTRFPFCEVFSTRRQWLLGGWTLGLRILRQKCRKVQVFMRQERRCATIPMKSSGWWLVVGGAEKCNSAVGGGVSHGGSAKPGISTLLSDLDAEKCNSSVIRRIRGNSICHWRRLVQIVQVEQVEFAGSKFPLGRQQLGCRPYFVGVTRCKKVQFPRAYGINAILAFAFADPAILSYDESLPLVASSWES